MESSHPWPGNKPEKPRKETANNAAQLGILQGGPSVATSKRQDRTAQARRFAPLPALWEFQPWRALKRRCVLLMT